MNFDYHQCQLNVDKRRSYKVVNDDNEKIPSDTTGLRTSYYHYPISFSIAFYDSIMTHNNSS